MSSNSFSCDSKGSFKICKKKQVYYEVAKYFRKANDYCRYCDSCGYCYGYNFVLGQLLFHRILFVHHESLYKH